MLPRETPGSGGDATFNSEAGPDAANCVGRASCDDGGLPSANPHAQSGGIDDDDEGDDDEGDDGEGDDEEASEADVELMALFLARGRRLGCARYIARTCRLEVFEVSVLLCLEGPGGQGWNSSSSGSSAESTLPILSEQDIPSSLLWLVQYMKVHEPLVFLPDRGAQPLEDIVKLVGAKSTKLQARTAFNEEEALPRLRAMYPQLSATEVAGRFNLGNGAMMAAMSALLHYTATVRCNVCDVVERAPLSVMYVEKATAQWLQITRTEQHPCDFQGIGRAKEGLSLFTAVSHAVSAHGRALLRQWFQLPSCDRAEIEQRQGVVRFFVTPERRDALRQLRRALLKVRPTNRIFTAMRSGRAGLPLFQSLLRTVKGLITVYEVLLPFAHELDTLHGLMLTMDISRLRLVARLIEANVYRVTVAAPRSGQNVRHQQQRWQAQTASLHPSRTPDDVAWVAYVDSGGLGSGRVSFHLGVDATLDQLRVLHSRLGAVLNRKAEEAFLELAGPLRYGLTIRGVYAAPHGYLLSVDGSRLTEAVLSEPRQLSATASPDFVFTENAPPMSSVVQLLTEQHGWQLQFTSPDPAVAAANGDGPPSELYFFKNAAMLQLDAEVGNLLQRIRSREDHLRRQLEESLLKESLCLLQSSPGIAELDCLLGFAHCAIHQQWVCPRVVGGGGGGDREADDDSALSIRGGWHPLLPLTMGAGGGRQPRSALGGGGGCSGGAASAVTAFDFTVDGPGKRVSVVTGGSGSGKSTLLTAVAHIVFLAHLGSFVPAAEATVGLTRHLYACCGVMDRGAFSSFEAECVTLNRIVRHCAVERAEWGAALEHGTAGQGRCVSPPPTTATTMILIDDFGRGTCPKDAVALLGATLRFFVDDGALRASRRQAPPRPLLLYSTHFIELFLPTPPLPLTTSCRARVDEQQEQQAVSSSLSFPFSEVAVYAMQSTAVFDPRAADTTRPALLPLLAKGDAGAANLLLQQRLHLPSDVIPTFQPVPIRDAAALQQGLEMDRIDFGSAVGSGASEGGHRSQPAGMLGAGLAVACGCGLDEEALGLWLKTLAALHGGDPSLPPPPLFLEH